MVNIFSNILALFLCNNSDRDLIQIGKAVYSSQNGIFIKITNSFINNLVIKQIKKSPAQKQGIFVT
ncbi:hypothetical protein C9J01_00050 [Photobacterium rosenbergii]|uniref:Uncharacterized protein n=1 Tax=Photobacterium rosenbergii TaxID=294936 RepID=A0A2T3NIW0_9GAMM|nr:hypothetical protein C9J01_00050 [Photobacterium rosenbergii]